MSQEQLKLGNSLDLIEAASRINEKILIYQKKIASYEKRKAYSQENRSFELYRRTFYRNLTSENKVEHDVPLESIKEFWSQMWETPEGNQNHDFDDYLLEHIEPENSINFLSFEEFEQTIRFQPNWKAAGPDGIYNFFIKKLVPIHKPLYEIIRNICLSHKSEQSWFYKWITYLIPKGKPDKGGDFRPITCMSNLYKLTTKCVTQIMQLLVESRGLLSENQLGTVRMVQGAKEQALINIAINKNYQNTLKTCWIDVRKAFDSIDYKYLVKCIKSLKFPTWINNFLETTISKWNIQIRFNNSVLIAKNINRGIIQGDSLSPLLFVLCMDPLSKKLNTKYQKVGITTDSGTYLTNHFLFIDDLKLLGEDENELERMVTETKAFFAAVGLEMNKEKSATNSEKCANEATLLEGKDSYKYLGIIENAKSEISNESFEKLRIELLSRVKRLCEKKLNAKNLFKGINEHAISIINYHVGVLKLEPEKYKKLDEEVRKILIEHKIHLQPANKERLYLPRELLGRGLTNIEHKSEHMLLQLRDTLEKSKNINLRRAAILKIEEENKSHLFLIKKYLMEKYKLDEKLTREDLLEGQKKALITDIKSKECHERLYRACITKY